MVLNFMFATLVNTRARGSFVPLLAIYLITTPKEIVSNNMNVPPNSDSQIENFYGEAAYHLYNIMSAECLSAGPKDGKLSVFDEILIRDGFLTLTGNNIFCLTEAGQLLAQGWLASQESRYARERKALLGTPNDT